MKKFIVVLLIIAIIPASLFAIGLFDIAIGIDAKYKPMGDELLKTVEDVKTYNFKPTDVIPGVAFDVKAFILDVNASIDVTKFESKAEAGSFCSSGFLGGGLAFDIFFVRLGLGAGYSYTFDMNFQENGTVDSDFSLRSYNASDYKCSKVEFKDFKNATMDLKVSADFKLGPISLGAYAIVPTDISLESFELGKVSEGFMGYLMGTTGGLRVMYHF